MTYTLRDHQSTAIQKLRESFSSGHRRPILQASTGFGKTLVAVDIIKSALDRGKKIIFCVDRIQLIDQTSEVFDYHNLDHGIIQSDHWRHNDLPLQLASVQTLTRRRNKPDVDLLIIDECHSVYKGMVKLMEKWSAVRAIGLSATPWTKGLGKIFDDLIVVESTDSLIKNGYLSDFVAYGSTLLDLGGLKTTAGDYNQKDLGERVNKQKIVGDVVTTWLKRGEDRKTVCFAVNVAHSKAIVDEFKANGVTAGHIDAHSTSDERDEVLSAHESGEVKVLCNVGITTKGWDSPDTTCLILARPTKSLMLYIQMVGRVLRVPSCGSNAVILDHGRNIERHGFPTDDMPQYLCNGDREEAEKRKQEEKKEKLPKPCEECSFMSTEFVCPSCGHKPSIAPGVVAEDGELKKLERVAPEEKAKWLGMLLGYSRSKGFNDGWASHQYREKFGVWPAKKIGVHAAKPDQDVLNYITYSNIKRAKSKTLKELNPHNPLHVQKEGFTYSLFVQSDGKLKIRCENRGNFHGWAKQTPELCKLVGIKK